MPEQRPLRFSLEGKLALFATALLLMFGLVALGAYYFTGHALVSVMLAALVAFLLALWAIRVFMQPLKRVLQALSGGMASLQDNDFSISIAETRNDELGDVVTAYNQLGGMLRDERQDLFQRELLLDTVIQSTPSALVLTNQRGHVVYSNSAARKMFAQGQRLEGGNFLSLVRGLAEPVRNAVSSGRDGLFAIEHADGQETFHLSQREFVLNAQPHQLYLFKVLTREISRQEVATWKKVIRVIGHELNNSLAPISSLAHSGTLLLNDESRLNDILGTIEERANHLKQFIDGYARFAKLPLPQLQPVDWEDFLGALQNTCTFRIDGELPATEAQFDPVQVEQVLINLIKNALESGSAADDIALSVHELPDRFVVRVLDRGPGMSEKVLHNALLPFYSTKQKGSGLGLPLCREIIEAHGGNLSLSNRSNGGLRVEFSMPRLALEEIASAGD